MKLRNIPGNVRMEIISLLEEMGRLWRRVMREDAPYHQKIISAVDAECPRDE